MSSYGRPAIPCHAVDSTRRRTTGPAMILSDVIARSWRFVPLGLALLLVGTPARGQDCGGGASDACERGPAALSPAATVHDRGAISPEAAKVASSVRDAIEAIASTAAVPSAPRDLRALSTRLVHVSATGELQLYVILGDFQPAHVQHLEASGLLVELTLPAHRLVQGWLPANLVDVVAALPFVVEVRAPGYPVAHVGAQVTAGDSILRADAARATFDVSGAGVTVGVISDGVDHLALSAATADVPSGVQVLQNPGGDEGTAMLEIVHDVAPGAGLAFYGPTTSADMVAGINALAGAGARVIVDDLTFLDEPKFQDGMIAQTARASRPAAGRTSRRPATRRRCTTARRIAGSRGRIFRAAPIPPSTTTSPAAWTSATRSSCRATVASASCCSGTIRPVRRPTTSTCSWPVRRTARCSRAA